MAQEESFELSVTRRLIPKLAPPYRQSAQVYVDCIPKLYVALCNPGSKYNKRNYLAQYLHTDPYIGLCFIMAMVGAKLLTLEHIRVSRTETHVIVEPTYDLVSMMVKGGLPPILTHVVREGFDVPDAKVRYGIEQCSHLEATSGIADTKFRVNPFVLNLYKETAPYNDSIMASRAVKCAEQLVDENSFKFGCFLDSRGRIYADTTIGISPQGADHEKAMCLPIFSEALSPAGLAALVAATDDYAEDTRYDGADTEAKACLYAAQALDWENLEWLQWDKPYCGMANARLIAEHLKAPEQPLAAFVPRDGRCSGLQHWSALMGSSAITDRLGMELCESADGMDIYEFVAFKWDYYLPEEYKYIATRKGAKKPVMTFAYSATRISAMDNVCDMHPELDRKVACQLGSQLFNTTNEVLQPIVAGVDWLKACMAIICATGVHQVSWETPDGFVASQDYRVTEEEDVTVVIKRRKHTITIKKDVLDEEGAFIPKLSKHKSAIGPNVIHSLDATHLRMVAIRLKEVGLPAVWVHDSFAVHANYIPFLDKVIREEFVKLYFGNYLLDLKRQWEYKYKVDLPDEPAMGDWDLNIIHKCDRFFL